MRGKIPKWINFTGDQMKAKNSKFFHHQFHLFAFIKAKVIALIGSHIEIKQKCPHTAARVMISEHRPTTLNLSSEPISFLVLR